MVYLWNPDIIPDVTPTTDPNSTPPETIDIILVLARDPFTVIPLYVPSIATH